MLTPPTLSAPAAIRGNRKVPPGNPLLAAAWAHAARSPAPPDVQHIEPLLTKAGEPRVELARDLDAQRQIFEQQPLVRRVDVRLGKGDAGQDRGDSAVGERGDDRQRPAGAREQRPPTEDLLEGVECDL